MENTPVVYDDQTPAPQEAEDVKQDALDTASKLLTPALDSLDSTQKNALDVSPLVEQVKDLSGHDQYVQANDAIMSDPSLDIHERLHLKWENDDRQDQRTVRGAGVMAGLQDANTRHCNSASYGWVAPTVVVCCVLFFGFTPPGRRLAKAALKAASRAI